jgi:hypothetical protein
MCVCVLFIFIVNIYSRVSNLCISVLYCRLGFHEKVKKSSYRLWGYSTKERKLVLAFYIICPALLD